MSSKKDLTDEDLEDELDKAFKENDAKRDHCGTPMPRDDTVGIQRTDVKLKKDK